jgi:DNA-binding response OmpR family regulator
MLKTNDLTLLYVEDDTALREQFIRVLKPRFKEVYEASDGHQALELYAQHSPDMMIVDINLPYIDGLEVIEKIRESNENMPVVIMSAYSDQEKLFKAVKLGLSDYLIKPVPLKKLYTVLDAMAEKYKNKIDINNLVHLRNDYIWKKEEKELCYRDETILLTKRERVLLEFMMQQLNKVVTFDMITDRIWENEEYSVVYSSLSHLLKRLRKKFPEELIENIYGEGYRITSGQ